MRGSFSLWNRQIRVLVVALLCVPTLLLGQAPAAVAQASYPDEAAMVAATNRVTFVYAPEVGELVTREQLLEPSVRTYYTQTINDEITGQFDINFLTWTPEVKLDVDETVRWTRCADPAPGRTAPCPAQHLEFREIRLAVGSGPLTMLAYDGAFIALACGNVSERGAPGPVPTISGVKYEDLDGNAQRDPGEPGLPGWTMELYYRGERIATSPTDSDGRYEFQLDANILRTSDDEPIRAGIYEVREQLQPGWVAVETPAPIDVQPLPAPLHHTGLDFGNYQPATIGGRKFHDRDVDGSGVGEPGVNGWTIRLDGTPLSTWSDGSYEFTGLAPGEYTVVEDVRDGWRQTHPLPAGAYTVTVQSGDVLGDLDFGNVCLADLDVGITDVTTGERLTDVEIRLEEVDVPGVLANEPALPRTSNGSFAGLLPGDYRVLMFVPDGLGTTDPDVMLVDGRLAVVKEISLAACDDLALDIELVSGSDGKVTGGSLLIDVPGGFATAGFVFMVNPSGLHGVLQYNDHGSQLNLHTDLIDILAVSGPEAWVWGRWYDGEVEQRFLLHVVDAGEPGRDDVFELLVTPDYSAGLGQTLRGGNIQVHGSTPQKLAVRAS